MSEWQRRNVLDGTGRQNLANRICELQGYRHPVTENAGVVVEFGQREDIPDHNFDVGLSLADIDDEWIGDLSPWVSLNARSPTERPEMRAALATNVREPAQYRVLALAVQFQVLPDNPTRNGNNGAAVYESTF